MSTSATRYRGAQPFGDNYVSRRSFFGRSEAAQALTNQVLANRLVVVYAKSGLGKSSLLNAGVAPLLRDAGLQPLLLRLNDVQAGPTASLLNAVRAEAQRQQVEYVDGDPSSLWRFFRTVEFWRDDLLLQPVLIIDQFEELFTLHSEASRNEFLNAFAPLARGVAPASDSAGGPGGDAPPLHIVLSLREDFLGVLEDAADRIPQILDHRFRLKPLSREDAAQAVRGPAELRDQAFSTAPFKIAPEFTDAVLDYLTQRPGSAAPAHGGLDVARSQIEPFHLQLICQRVEDIVSGKLKPARAGPWETERAFTLADFGGEAALASTLKKFYVDALASVSNKAMQRASRRLCEQFLISPEGRRLSLDQHEIVRQLGLTPEALQQLVDSRLLRTDRRSDNVYYELGHDALVEPILATKRTQARLMAGLALSGGLIGSAIPAVILVYLLAWGLFIEAKDDTEPVVAVVMAIICAMVLPLPLRLLAVGSAMRRRYRMPDERKADETEEAAPAVHPLRRILGITISSSAALLSLVLAFFLLLCVAVLLALAWGQGQIPEAVAFLQPMLEGSEKRPVVEFLWALVEISVLLLFTAKVWRFGRRWAGRGASARPASALPASAWQTTVLPVAAGALLALCLWLGSAIGACAWHTQGVMPAWLPARLVSDDLPKMCLNAHQGHWSEAELAATLVVLAAGLALALPVLWRWLRAAMARRGP